MFDVIICTVNTGRVFHKLFDTYDDASSFANTWLEKRLKPKDGQPPKKSARDYRITVEHHELPVVRSVMGLGQAVAA